MLPLIKDENYNMVVDDLGYDGTGIGKIDGFTVFVNGGLPRDEIEIKIIKIKKNFAIGKIVKFNKRSAFRQKSLCEYFPKCGGCQLQDFDYNAQLIYKEKRVEDSIRRLGEIKNVKVSSIVGMEEPYNYRNKAQFQVSDFEGKPKIGFYERNSHNIIDVNVCNIQDKKTIDIVKNIREYIEENNISAYNEKMNKGVIRNIIIKTGFVTEETMVIIVINSDKLPKKELLIEKLKYNENVRSIALNINKRKSSLIFGNKTEIIFGNEYIIDYIGNIKFEISPLSFFQVNPKQTKKLYGEILKISNLTGKENILDIYCGIGTITLFLSNYAKKVTGIEVVPEAIEDAKRNAEINGVKNVEFIQGEASESIKSIYSNKETYDIVIIDPPRKGCEDSVINTILDMESEKIIYVSCEPSTLSRDLKKLCENKYEVKIVKAFDQFPMTMGVETVVLLQKH